MKINYYDAFSYTIYTGEKGGHRDDNTEASCTVMNPALQKKIHPPCVVTIIRAKAQVDSHSSMRENEVQSVPICCSISVASPRTPSFRIPSLFTALLTFCEWIGDIAADWIILAVNDMP